MGKSENIWKRIITYYLIALAYTLTVGLLIVNQILPGYFHYFATWGPAIGAFVMFSLDHEFTKRIKELFVIKKPLWVWVGGTSPLWISLFFILLLPLLGFSLPALSTIGEVNFLGNISFWVLPLWILTTAGEEFGWRGFLYPELRKKYPIMTATAIMWPLWVIWHLPFFLYISTYSHMNIGLFIGFVFSLLSGVIVLNWIFEKSGRNLITTILWHGCFNVVTASVFGSGNIAMYLSMLVVFYSFVILASWKFPNNRVLAKVGKSS